MYTQITSYVTSKKVYDIITDYEKISFINIYLKNVQSHTSDCFGFYLLHLSVLIQESFKITLKS